ncbi:GGDEF domain-containing protein [Catenovulum sp. SM1970]|uniref:GGDEF domain-containing protein n=1 Tax=Marinifaba aquimaris TaxID=2741323 RepID=UPI0015734F74|nr:GGDEF domain-containing protein [Marinifaba aquimaris]NTS75577.1 GGDEF domain-containing protein [Marinifaba aquimaris]
MQIKYLSRLLLFFPVTTTAATTESLTVHYYHLAFVLIAVLGLLAFLSVLAKNYKNQIDELKSQLDDSQQNLVIAEEKIRFLNLTDALTGLRNRNFFDMQIKADVAKSLREYKAASNNGGIPLQADINVIIVNIDDFASINAKYGHSLGDSYLKAVAGVIKREIRAGDYLIRLNSDEFMIVTRFSSRDKVPEVASRLKDKIANQACVYNKDKALKRTVTIGSASFPFFHQEPENVSINQVVLLAYHALNAAKATKPDAWMRLIGGNAEHAPKDISDINALVDASCISYHSSIASDNPINWQSMANKVT